jgi:hypothetical protein
MIEENFARLRTHRSNIRRYRQLLQTRLTELERQFIEKRLSEEQSAVECLAATTFPPTLKFRHTAAQDSREA